MVCAGVQNTISLSTVSGIPSLTLTLTALDPAKNDMLGNAGHPELIAFKKHLQDGTANSLEYSFVPGFAADGSDLIQFKFIRAPLPPLPPPPNPPGANRMLSPPPADC